MLFLSRLPIPWRLACGLRAPAVVIDPTGDWQNADGSFRISLKVNGDGLTYTDQAGNSFPMIKASQPNSYMFANTAFVLAFTSKDAGSMKFNDAPIPLTRRNAPAPPTPATQLVLAAIPGRYVRANPENDFHEGVIELVQIPGGQPSFRWTNKAGVAWSLQPKLDRNELQTASDNPYFDTNPDNGRIFKLTQRKNPDGALRAKVESFTFMDEVYRRN